ncbi:MAG: prolipoprotein diacylglyceryl transferase [Candidatus Thiodiazotropha sp. L084R]
MEQQTLDFIVWNIDPTLISFAGLEIRWYGALFALAYLLGYQTIHWIYQNEGRETQHLERLSVYLVIATIAGARLGHCLFYDPGYYLSHPLKILAFWEGGLASHGGGLGVLFALYIHKRQSGETYLWLLDHFAIPTALVGMLIRLGNLFNSEIYGTPTNLPWAFIFERIDQIPRHPAQLYEAIAYGLIFIALLVFYRRMGQKIKDGLIFGLFLVAVFSTRFLVEFVKTKQAAYSSDVWLSTGQMLSLPFIAGGLILILLALRGDDRRHAKHTS